MCVVCVCRFGVIFTYVIEGITIDSKVISVCLINDYSLTADLHIFVYESAECASISLECTKVKLWLYVFETDWKLAKEVINSWGNKKENNLIHLTVRNIERNLLSEVYQVYREKKN